MSKASRTTFPGTWRRFWKSALAIVEAMERTPMQVLESQVDQRLTRLEERLDELERRGRDARLSGGGST